MPAISIVLPTYGVAGFLRECLDSIVTQSFADVEIVAVDDASPDNCGTILDEYAALDCRIRVIHLTENVGLGPARNIGLAEATGDYVWFVDSDDYLTEGALAAVADAIGRTHPDVVLIDHAKVWFSGKAKPSTLSRRLPEADLTSVTPRLQVLDPAEHPEVLRPLHTAWSRLVRRDFLVSTGLRFRPGWYEDVSFTYPITAAARRVAVLRRICYGYRQRRTGSITGRRADARHFQIFEQYGVLWSEFDRLRITDPGVRAMMFDRMIWHYRWVLGESQRIPPELHRAFFDRTSVDYRRYAPPGWRAPSLLEAVKQDLIARDGWAAFAAAGHARDALARNRKRARNAARMLTRARRVGRRAALHTYYQAQLRLPLDPKLAVYAAYWYRGVRCNPAAIYEKAREMVPDVHGVWIVRPDRLAEVPAGVDVAVEGSRRYFQVLARATYLINNVNFPDFFVKRPGTVFLQTHHGTPLKVMGMDHYRFPVGALGEDLQALLRRCDAWDLSISTSSFNTEIWQRAYPCDHVTLEIGYPRNDRLALATPADTAAARARLGLADGERAVLYAPTHREYQNGFEPLLDLERVADALGPDCRILTRSHYFYDAGFYETGGRTRPSRPDHLRLEHARIIDVSDQGDVESLYLAADVLVTDYSSAMFDYAYLDRPIVIFAPDWEAYRRTRGVTFDLFATPPGAVTTTTDQFVAAFLSGEIDGEAATKARADFRERFCPHMDGRSSERAVRRLFQHNT